MTKPNTPDQEGASEEPQLPVIVSGKQVGTLPLSTEYRIMIDHILMSWGADLDYFKGRLKEIDDAVSEHNSSDHKATTDTASMPSSSMNTPDTPLREQFEKILFTNIEHDGSYIPRSALEKKIPDLEALCQEIAREAAATELKKFKAVFATDLSVDTYESLIHRIAKLTHKPAREA